MSRAIESPDDCLGLAKNSQDSLPPTQYTLGAWFAKLKELEKNESTTAVIEESTADRLRVLRQAALIANAGPINPRDSEGWQFAHAWVLFLCTRTQDTFFLQHYRVKDAVFYEQRQASGQKDPLHLQPKPRSRWGSSEQESSKWQEKLSWLEDPELLTIAELELALAIFEWDTERPRFVWWIDQYPHILRRIHAFLLKCYCWALLDAYEEACSEIAPPTWSLNGRFPRAIGRWMRRIAEWSTPREQKRLLTHAPFKAGTTWWLYPRMWGMVAVGNLALLGASPVDAFFFGVPGASPPVIPERAIWHLTIGAVAIVIMLIFVQADVFKQNHGLMASPQHVRPRVCGLLRRFLIYGLLTGLLSAIFLGRFGADPSLGVTTLDRLIAVTAQVLSGTTVGIVLQWFWADFAATDTV